MCLANIDPFNADLPDSGYGWKVFDIAEGYPRFIFQGSQAPLPFNVRLDSRDFCRAPYVKITSSYSGPYDKGFHIFKSRKDARLARGSHSKVFRVQYANVVCHGRENWFAGTSAEIVVAREMKIIPNNKKGNPCVSNRA
jgi:hypothetical protein